MPGEKHLQPDEVRHVARLARLALDDARLAKYASQLASILHYVEKIRAASMEGVEPMAHALPVKNVFREDVAGAALEVEQVLQNAPQTDGRFFRVPKIIGGDEDSAG